MAKMGRPPKKIDKEKFEMLCGVQCTESEICAALDVTDKTLAKWCNETYGLRFSEVFAQKRKIGLVSLRRTQFRLAQNNAKMATFLGIQYLGQSNAPRARFEDLKPEDDDLTKSLKELGAQMSRTKGEPAETDQTEE